MELWVQALIRSCLLARPCVCVCVHSFLFAQQGARLNRFVRLVPHASSLMFCLLWKFSVG